MIVERGRSHFAWPAISLCTAFLYMFVHLSTQKAGTVKKKDSDSTGSCKMHKSLRMKRYLERSWSDTPLRRLQTVCLNDKTNVSVGTLDGGQSHSK